MYLQDLRLENFRNIHAASIQLGQGVTVFVGPNGQGKTNLLESIVYAATLESHRVSSDAALVKVGHEQARVEATFRTGARRSVVDITIMSTGANRVELNGNTARRRHIAGQFPLVMFSPSDLGLVSGDPGERRGFLNELILQLRPGFIDPLTSYERILKQRNSLLKSARSTGAAKSGLATLDDWDEQLATYGAMLMHRRAETVDALQPHVSAAYQAIASTDDPVEIALDTTVAIRPTSEETAVDFVQKLREGRDQDLERGITLIGPHRDELVLRLDGLVVRHHASHGESWSYALSLRLASARLVREQSRVGDPIVILDDVFAELDRPRRAKLAELVSEFEQVLISAAVEEELPAMDRDRRIRVRQGVIGSDDIS